MNLNEAIDFVESNLTEKRWKEGDEVNDELRGALKIMQKHGEVIRDLNKARLADRFDSYKIDSKEKSSIKALADAVVILAKYRVAKANFIGKTALASMKKGEIPSTAVLFLYYILNDMSMGKFGKEFDSLY